jgi:iron complex outermembrane receptor protein
MKILKVLSLICFLWMSAFAQQSATISGIVSDLQKPLANVKVILVSPANQTLITQTDEKGFYTFETIAAGKYRISVLRADDNILISKEIEIGANQSLTADLTLGIQAPSNIKYGEVTVVASGTAQPIAEVSKTVNIIEAQELRDRADFALAETLKTIPGFRVQQLGGFGRTATVKTRGLRNQDTAVLIDGIRFRDASAITGDASAFLSDFTLTSVSRIEVLRGSGSSLYGTNAIGGTIDFQTPKPQSGLHGQIGGAFGGYGLGRFRGNLSDGTEDGKFGFNLGISRTVYAKGIDGEDDAHNTNFQSRVEYNPFPNTNISTRFFVSDAYVRLNSNPDTLGVLPALNSTIIEARPNVNFVFDTNDPDNFQKSKFFNGQIVLTQIINKNLVFQGYYSGLKTSRKNENGTSGVGFQSASTSFFDGTINTANGHFNWTPNRFNGITFGYEYEAEKYGNDGFTPNGAGNFFTRARQSSNTFYAQDLLQFFNNRLQIAGGFRAQFFNLKTPEFSLSNAPYKNVTLENPPTAYTFDAAISYFFNKTKTKIRAHVGNGYRVPSLYERFGTFYSSFGTPRFIALGEPNLQPEKTIAFDGGIEQNLFNNRAALTAVYFYTKLIDTIGYGNIVGNVGTTTRPFGGYLNTKGGIARGGEFSGRFKATSSTDIFASYTYTNSDQRVPQVSGSRILQTLGIPKHQYTLVATQRYKRAWVNFDFLATGDYLAPIFSNQTFKAYVYQFRGNRKADLTAGYTFPMNNEKLNLRVFGTIENLFDYEYYENGFRTFGRNARIGLSFGF